MTYNYLLLYRLAELMLLHEQHILPVDLLFDDEQIGDFVKSIQIDSPYQQMLFAGVLTESVKEEKLYVCFTVEGYFHYVLGEVLERTYKEKDGSQLADLVKKAKLKGIAEAIQELLIRDIDKKSTSRVRYFLDQENSQIKKLYKLPLIHAMGSMGAEAAFQSFFGDFNPANTPKILTTLIQDLRYLGRQKLLNDLQEIIWKKVKPENIPTCELLSLQIAKSPIVEIKKFEECWTTIFKQQGQPFDQKISRSVHNIFKRVGEGYLQHSDKHKALYNYKKSISALGRRAAYRKEKLQAKSILALVMKGMGKSKEAEKIYWNIIEQTENYGYWLVNAKTKLRLSEIYKQDENLPSALELANEVVPVFRKMFGNYHSETSSALGYLGSIRIYEKKWDMAKPLIEDSMKIRMRLLGENNTKTCISYVNYAEILMNLGQFSESRQYLERALNIRARRFGEKHQDVAYTLFKIAKLEELENRLVESISIHCKALAIREAKLGNDHLFTQLSRWELLRLYATLNDKTNFYSIKQDYINHAKVTNQLMTEFLKLEEKLS